MNENCPKVHFRLRSERHSAETGYCDDAGLRWRPAEVNKRWCLDAGGKEPRAKIPRPRQQAIGPRGDVCLDSGHRRLSLSSRESVLIAWKESVRACATFTLGGHDTTTSCFLTLWIMGNVVRLAYYCRQTNASWAYRYFNVGPTASLSCRDQDWRALFKLFF